MHADRAHPLQIPLARLDAAVRAVMTVLGQAGDNDAASTLALWSEFASRHAALTPQVVEGVSFAISAIEAGKPFTQRGLRWASAALPQVELFVRTFPASEDILPRLRAALAVWPGCGDHTIAPDVVRVRIVQRDRAVFLETTRQASGGAERIELEDLEFIVKDHEGNRQFTAQHSARYNAEVFLQEMADVESLLNCTSLIGEEGRRWFEAVRKLERRTDLGEDIESILESMIEPDEDSEEGTHA